MTVGFGGATATKEAQQPRVFQNLPTGFYLGEFQGTETMVNNAGTYEALAPQVQIQSIDDVAGQEAGATQFTVDGRTYPVGRSFSGWDSATITTSMTNEHGEPREDEKAERAYEIAREQAAALAAALGLVEPDTEGNVSLPDWVTTAESLAEFYSGAQGRTVRVQIINEVQREKAALGQKRGAVIRDETGQPVRRNRVKGIFAASTAGF